MYDNGKTFPSSCRPLTPYPQLNSIACKVKQAGGESIQRIYFGATKFNLPNLYKRFPSLKKGICKTIGTHAFDLPIWRGEGKEGDVAVYGMKNGKREVRYIEKDCVEEGGNLKKWKVIFPRANGSGAIGEKLSTPVMGTPVMDTPVMGYTDTFCSFGAFDREAEAKACLKYVKSKFARACLGIKKVTQHNTKVAWEYVPLQDFTKKSDIDWSLPIKDIDKRLYEKYALSEEEIEFIEKNVREME